MSYDELHQSKSLHTLNARGNILLESVREQFQVSPAQMFREIQWLRRELEDALLLKGIRYDDLKTALIPDRKRREMALVFDSRAIESHWYALPVFRRLLPLFNKDSNHSVLLGDYIDVNEHQSLLFTAMNDAVTFAREVNFEHSSQFFVVYINNLSEAMIAHFHSGMREWEGYVGYADTTYASPFKTLLSTMLANGFIKHRKFIIQGHEDDRPNTENVNTCGYPFEEFGFVCVSIQSYLEGTLLSYKIERPVFSGFESDVELSLNSISASPQQLDNFTVEIEEAKLMYLKSAKGGSLVKAGLGDTTTTQLAELIQSKISSSYIYNLSYDESHDTAKFNVIVELPCLETGEPVRLLVALDYKPVERRLRLITFY